MKNAVKSIQEMDEIVANFAEILEIVISDFMNIFFMRLIVYSQIFRPEVRLEPREALHLKKSI